MACLFVIIWLSLCATAMAIEPYDFENTAEETRFRDLLAELRCVMCQNQSLADSNAGIAADLRREVFDLMRDGETDLQIKEYLVERYSEFVLYQPQVRPGTWLLWFGPAAIVAFGGLIIFRIVRANRTADKPIIANEKSQEW